jgi:hypothetical protein
MSTSDDERRYSDEEFAVILRTASEVSERPNGRDPLPPRGGLTLAEIKKIAAEVGLDPERVSRAAALLPTGEDSVLTRLVGGGPRHRVEQTVKGLVPAGELGRLIQVARTKVAVQGETREVLGGLEWTGSTATTGYGVSVTPRGGQTNLQAWTNQTETMAGIYGGVGMSVMGIVAVTLGKLVFGETDTGILAAVLSGVPPAFLVARSVWKRAAKKHRRRLLELLDGIRREAESVVVEPEAREPEAE